MGRRARLMILSSHRLFRESLGAALARSERFTSIEQSATPEETHRNIDGEPLDVLLLDLSQPPAGATEMVHEITQEPKSVKVLLLGADESEASVLRCVEVGASGSLPIESSLEDLCGAIERVMRGEAVCSPGVASSMFSRLAELSLEHQRRERLEALKLTPREMEILKLLASSLRNKTIAARLKLSVHTVKNHVHNILDKLQVQDRNEAVDLAYRRGWLRERRRR